MPTPEYQKVLRLEILPAHFHLLFSFHLVYISNTSRTSPGQKSSLITYVWYIKLGRGAGGITPSEISYNRKLRLSPVHPLVNFEPVNNRFATTMPLLRRRLVCFYCGRRSAKSHPADTRDWGCENCDAVNYLDEVRSSLSMSFLIHAVAATTYILI